MSEEERKALIEALKLLRKSIHMVKRIVNKG